MPLSEFARRAAIVAGIALLTGGLGVFLWLVGRSALVLFAAILLAVMLDGLARVLVRHARMPRWAALGTVIVVIVAILVGIFLFGGLRITSQAPALQRDMEHAIARIGQQLKAAGLDVGALASQPMAGKFPGVSGLFGSLHIGGYVSASVDMIIDFVILVVAGVYFAATPRFYVNTVVMLAPKHRRARLRTVGNEIAHALRRWLIGRFAAMLAVGILTWIGLALLHVELAALLAVIACLLTFVPYLGVIVAVIPAVLMGMLTSPVTALYVVLLYVCAHAMEGYVLSPLIQRQTVHVAPGWLIMSQLVGALAAGMFGMLIAAPVLVALTVLVQMLYVEDVLGDKVRVLGE